MGFEICPSPSVVPEGSAFANRDSHPIMRSLSVSGDCRRTEWKGG
jgi:hypothetical protein